MLVVSFKKNRCGQYKYKSLFEGVLSHEYNFKKIETNIEIF